MFVDRLREVLDPYSTSRPGTHALADQSLRSPIRRQITVALAQRPEKQVKSGQRIHRDHGVTCEGQQVSAPQAGKLPHTARPIAPAAPLCAAP
ncbi:hypothetical protein J6590_007921 [Homalodisca vitripennis]|nr:hypothetical protein J6590_007921 [Homalodisca vitripennis]